MRMSSPAYSSLVNYRSEIRQVAERPTLDRLRGRLAGRAPTTLSVAPADAIRAERDGR
jgi:hypothetical protein